MSGQQNWWAYQNIHYLQLPLIPCLWCHRCRHSPGLLECIEKAEIGWNCSRMSYYTWKRKKFHKLPFLLLLPKPSTKTDKALFLFPVWCNYVERLRDRQLFFLSMFWKEKKSMNLGKDQELKWPCKSLSRTNMFQNVWITMSYTNQHAWGQF